MMGGGRLRLEWPVWVKKPQVLTLGKWLRMLCPCRAEGRSLLCLQSSASPLHNCVSRNSTSFTTCGLGGYLKAYRAGIYRARPGVREWQWGDLLLPAYLFICSRLQQMPLVHLLCARC